MLTPVRSSQFKRDVRRANKRGKDLSKLRRLLAALVMQQPLAARHRDHPLRGIWKGYREAHVEADWLVIYRVEGEELRLVRTGTHSDLRIRSRAFDARLRGGELESMGETQAKGDVQVGEEWETAPPGEIVDVVTRPEATLDDLDLEGMCRFVRIARRARQFPLPAETPPEDLLRHLNLLNKGRLTNAAMLLFGKVPQRFLISSVIECAHFHGTAVAKPIPFYRVYKGTAFALVDQAVDFVLGKIALAVGTRAESVQAPVAYEIPKEVVTEAIVNAVAHRDYTDGGSTQVMLFADRLEVMNPGRLPPPLTIEKLRVPHPSLPGNPLLAESMYLLRYIEKMGTGTVDMIQRCVEAGLREPEFDVGTTFVTRIWRARKITWEPLASEASETRAEVDAALPSR